MKKLIKVLFNKIGYDFIKINQHSNKKINNIKNVLVGNFELEMPGNNPLISSYKYEPELNFELGRLSKIIISKYPNATILDIGANVGDTIAVIKSFIDSDIIAIEGDKFSFSFLEKNILQFKNVTVFNKYLGEKKTSISAKMDKSGWNNTIIPDENTNSKIELDTIDNIIQQFKEAIILKLIKIDTEGFDPIILRGSIETIKEHTPIIFIEYNRENMEAIGENGLEIFKTLSGLNYDKLAIFDHQGRFIISLNISENEILNYLHFYAFNNKSSIPYYDICFFHKNDADIATQFIDSEYNKNL